MPRGSSGSAGTTSTTRTVPVPAPEGGAAPGPSPDGATASCRSNWATSGLAAEAVSTVVPPRATTIAP
jgi:hypothetical protein